MGSGGPEGTPGVNDRLWSSSVVKKGECSYVCCWYILYIVLFLPSLARAFSGEASH